MAKETKEERRARIQKEVAAESAARQKAYFETQAKSKAAATAAAAPLPKPDAYTYDYAWRQDVGAPTGQLNLIKFQNPYYDASTNTIVDPATGERTDAIPSMVSGPTSFRGDLSTVKDPYAGLTPEQIEAKKNAEELAARLGLSIDPNTGMIIKPPANFVIDPVTGKYTDPSKLSKPDPNKLSKPEKTETGRTTNSDGSVTITYSDGSKVTIPASNANNNGNNSNGNIPPGLDAATIALIQSLQNQINTLTTNNQQAAIDKAAADAAAKKEKAESAIAVLTERFTKYNLASLVPKIKELAIGGAGESTITLQLQETEEYKQRFRANQKRIEKGLRVLAPGDYLGMEDDYRQILRAYGLKQFDNDDYVTQFISNDISDTELTNRVVTAVQRVQNADPAILNTLRSFYGISDNDLVAYVLDPNQQFQKIERQVAAAEIGAAAKLQGINAGVAVSEQLAAQGITKAQAQKGYSTIADSLPTAEKLSGIYGDTLEKYDLKEAEQDVFNTLASAQRKRKKLIETELATFSGTSGLTKSSLSSQLGGTY